MEFTLTQLRTGETKNFGIKDLLEFLGDKINDEIIMGSEVYRISSAVSVVVVNPVNNTCCKKCQLNYCTCWKHTKMRKVCVCKDYRFTKCTRNRCRYQKQLLDEYTNCT